MFFPRRLQCFHLHFQLHFKVSKHAIVNSQDGDNGTPVKKHGIGKGLMTVWRVINPNGGDFPTGINFGERQITDVPQISTPVSQKPRRQNKKRRQPVSVMVSHLFSFLKIFCSY